MTTFTIEGVARVQGVPTNGQQVVAYDEARFGSVPLLGSPFPDASPADAGPVISSEAFGGVGHWKLTVPTADDYYVGNYAIGDPNQVITWIGPRSPTPHTSLQGWTSANANLTAFRPTTSTLITAGSNGAVLPQTSISVANSAPWTIATHALIALPNYVLISVGGTSGGNTLTACSGGTGTLGTNDGVFPAFVNGANRRLVMVTFDATTTGTTDTAWVYALSAVGGAAATVVAEAGVTAPTGGVHTVRFQVSFPIDPFGGYALAQQLVGGGGGTGGSISVQYWVEVDF